MLAPSLILNLEKLTYKELQSKSLKIRNWLISKNVKRGDKVLLLIPLSTELYATIIALLRIGAIGVLYEPKDIFWQLNNTTKQVKPDFLITSKKTNFFLNFNKFYRSIKKKLFIEETFYIKSDNLRNLSDNVNLSDLALINFTSGSEGVPKGICRDHGFLLEQHKVLQKYMKLNKEDVILTTLPVFVLSMLVAGSFVVIPRLKKNLPWYPDSQSIEMIKKLRVNLILGASAFIQQLIKETSKKKEKLPSIKKVIIGGCFLEKKLIKQLKYFLSEEVDIEIIYGSTEAEPVSHINIKELNDAWDKYSLLGYCVGKPIKDITAKIIPFSKNPIEKSKLSFVGEGDFGELIVSGTHINKKYIPQEPAFSKNKIIDDSGKLWHRMGDGAYFDKKGRIWLVGRFKHLPQEALDNFSNYINMEIELKKLYNTSKLSFVENKNGPIIYIESSFLNKLSNKKRKKAMSIIQRYGFNCNDIYIRKKLPLDRRHNSKISYGDLKK